MVLTSNRSRPLGEALRRRCAYLYLQYPDLEKEIAIIRAKLPNANEHLAVQVAEAVKRLRENDAILKKPSIAETLDWVSALEALGISDLTAEDLGQLTQAPAHQCGCGGEGGGCGHHHHHGGDGQ